MRTAPASPRPSRCSPDEEIAEDIYTGSIVAALVRPVGYPASRFAAALPVAGVNALLVAGPLLLVFLALVPLWAPTPAHLLLFLGGSALWEVGRKLVRTGEFHKYLVRPTNTLYGVLSERFLYPDGFGEVLVGVALTAYAGRRLDLSLSPVQLLLAPLLVVGGALIFAAIKLLLASAAFWTTDSLPAMDATYQTSSFAAYPLDIYHPSLRSLLIWVLPFAFTSYAPARYLLFGETSLLRWMPVVIAALVAVALLVWRRGLQRYEMSDT